MDETFLDLYAGTGAVSLEALSRGADRVVVVEQSRRVRSLLQRNLDELSVPVARYELLGHSVHDALPVLKRRGLAFRLAWCDPPFDDWQSAVTELSRARDLGVLPPQAEIVLETPPRRAFDFAGFQVLRQLRGAQLIRVLG